MNSLASLNWRNDGRRVTDRSRSGPVKTTAVPVDGTAYSPTRFATKERSTCYIVRPLTSRFSFIVLVITVIRHCLPNQLKEKKREKGRVPAPALEASSQRSPLAFLTLFYDGNYPSCNFGTQKFERETLLSSYSAPAQFAAAAVATPDADSTTLSLTEQRIFRELCIDMVWDEDEREGNAS
ncbi:hypothetical protein B0H13DRAFT_2395227 [Mycena leptocephala]|nr:hypothetical protein B0H13DRAFT_2395227 [Mycena leptocephala]